MRRDTAAMLITTLLTWMGQRLTAVALPLVALAETHSTWTAGLVGGAVGVPMLTSAWWARSLRQRLTNGRALALVLAVQVIGVLIVPVTVQFGQLQAVHLAAAGIVVGCATALSGPAQQALLADLSGDPLHATKMLAWQDFMHRSTMIVAPPLAGWAVAYGWMHQLLWAEAIGLALAALLMATVRGHDVSIVDRRPEKLRTVLARYPQIRRAVTISAVGGLTWFAFSLGLAVMGAEMDMPGLLISVGMSGYGIGSVAGALLAPTLVPKLPPLATAAAGWAILGLAYMVMPLLASDLLMLGIVAALGGFAMPLAIGSVNRIITVQTQGAERRAAFAAEGYLHSGAASLGLLVGGAIIGLIGSGLTLVLAGLVQVVVALAAGWPSRSESVSASPA